MHCDRVRDRIGMLLDGELPADERDAVNSHAADCPECKRYRDELERLRRHLRQAGETAPGRLMQRVSSQLAVEASQTGPEDETLPTKPRFNKIPAARLTRYARQAAAILLACAVSIAATWWWAQRTDATAALSHDLLSAHMRALIQDNAVQIASLDTHTVKPWFAGRLEYSPTVKDLSADGFQLVGGRLDYVDKRRVATLVYRRRLHQISVFVWPSDGRPIASYSARVDGYTVLGWNKASMSYWTVSDINEGELRELQALL
jgi:anti-sigma factor (TIGR02949 family)